MIILKDMDVLKRCVISSNIFDLKLLDENRTWTELNNDCVSFSQADYTVYRKYFFTSNAL